MRRPCASRARSREVVIVTGGSKGVGLGTARRFPTLYASGIEPGFAADHLALTLTTLVHRVDSVRTQEIFTCEDYPVAFTMRIEGEPSLHCDLQLGTEETFNDAGMLATAMRLVNAIPYVCAAAPGITDALALPLTPPRG